MCGIIAVYNNNGEILECLSKLQHRGKDGVGIVSKEFDSNDFDYIKKTGTFLQNKESLTTFSVNKKPNISIGHMRYSTTNTEDFNKELQPLIRTHIALAHNGNIPNIKGDFNLDTEYLMKLLTQSESMNFEEKLIDLMNSVYSAYTLVVIYENNLYVVRDRYGIRPLCYGTSNTNQQVYVSSESVAIEDYIDSNIFEVKPGEILKINETGIQSIYQHPQAQQSICAFELIYFMNPDSLFQNIRVSQYRKALGLTLAKKETIPFNDMDYVVCGVPSTGIIPAQSFAACLKLPYYQFINKRNKCQNGADRTFILPNQDQRIKAVNAKFVFDDTFIKNKNLIIVDDTIVRGNIIKGIIKTLKYLGAKEIHVRIPAPKVINICSLGIAIHSKEELIAYNNSEKQINDLIGSTSLKYLETKDLHFFPKLSYMECFGVDRDSINLSAKYAIN